jgi:hypothetical protein
VGDLGSLAQTRSVAEQVNKLGAFDAIIHNAGVGYRGPKRVETEDGLPQVFAINTLAPYVLTALIMKPKRLVYLSSGMHHGANTNLDDLRWTKRRWNGSAAYAETKFHDVCWPLRWRGCFRTCSPTLSNPAGCRPKWAARVPPTIWTPRQRRKRGWQRATIGRRWFPANIFIISVSWTPIRLRVTSRSSRTCWINAGRCPEFPGVTASHERPALNFAANSLAQAS